MNQNKAISDDDQGVIAFKNTIDIKVEVVQKGVPYEGVSRLAFCYIFSYYGYNPEVARILQYLSKSTRYIYVKTRGLIGWLKSYPNPKAVLNDVSQQEFARLFKGFSIDRKLLFAFIAEYYSELNQTAQTEFDANIECMKYLLREHPRIYMFILEKGQMWKQHESFLDYCRACYENPQDFSLFVQCNWRREVDLLAALNSIGRTVVYHEGYRMDYFGGLLAGKAYGEGIAAIDISDGERMTIRGTFSNNQLMGVCITSRRDSIEIAEWRPTRKGSVRFGKCSGYYEMVGGKVRWCENMLFSHGGKMVWNCKVERQEAFFADDGDFRGMYRFAGF